jgi:hypothetical protein
MVHKGALITVIAISTVIIAMAAYHSSGGNFAPADTVTDQTVTVKIPDSYFLKYDCHPTIGNAQGEATYWSCPYGTEVVYDSYLKDHPELKPLQ